MQFEQACRAQYGTVAAERSNDVNFICNVGSMVGNENGKVEMRLDCRCNTRLDDDVDLGILAVDMLGELGDRFSDVWRVELLDEKKITRRSGPSQRQQRRAGLSAL